MNTFPRSKRLRTKNDFALLFKSGRSFSAYPVKTIYYFEKSETPTCLFGVTASKRNFKHAVKRNRVKRLLREAIRLNKQSLEACCEESGYSLKVLFIYQNNKLPSFKVIEDKLVNSLGRLTTICEGLDSETTA